VATDTLAAFCVDGRARERSREIGEQDIQSSCGLLNSWAADLVNLDPWAAFEASGKMESKAFFFGLLPCWQTRKLPLKKCHLVGVFTPKKIL